METEPKQVIHYEKFVDGRIVQCSVEVFEDGAYVYGDEIEMIFEFQSDSVSEAIRHVEELGYLRSS